jgi:hypothetical protein
LKRGGFGVMEAVGALEVDQRTGAVADIEPPGEFADPLPQSPI